MADLQELLARLQSNSSSRPRTPHQSQPQASQPVATTSYHQPSVISEAPTPVPMGSQPRNASDVLSPTPPSSIQTPLPESNARSANLLNLLKFSQQPSAPLQSVAATGLPQQSAPAGAETSGAAPRDRPISASDLVASYMRKPSSTSVHSPTATKPGEVSASAGGSSQAYLLNLLNQAKPSMSSRPSSLRAFQIDDPVATVEHPAKPIASDPAIESLTQTLKSSSLEHSSASPAVERKPPSIRHFGSQDSGLQNTFEAPKAPTKPGIFSYVNPFEQLSASSPRNQTPVPQLPADFRPKLPETTGSSLPNVGHDESVPEALEVVGARADREVAEALALVSAEMPTKPVELSAAVTHDIEQAVIETAVEMKEELKDEETRKIVEEVVGKEATGILEEVVDKIAHDSAAAEVADSWESADAEETALEEKHTVKVYNFPMRPFVSLSVAGDLGSNKVAFSHDAHLAIARMKKDFDQNDRALVDATDQYIAYVSPKSSGIRVISQDDGKFKNLFQGTQERVVNVTLCSTLKPLANYETVLATGVDGSVFWAHLSGEKEVFADNLDDRSVIFPAFSTSDDNTSGGQLKTRARRSSRNPKFFAIGRGKAIHLIWPHNAATSAFTNPKTRICDTNEYLGHENLFISTGKAGKDFAFSQCDSVIASLDKTGKVKFWDIRGLFQTPPKSLEIKKPILSLATTNSSDKSWPTSVMFLDKERPFNKGIALRYMLVGMKQNHSLQLWDLCLQKPVQEINLPHENESDGICSVTYHAQSSIIAVGHPTRNSIYFIHLSAPRYLLPAMPQAKFLTRVAEGDPSLPKVESTAIMTGIREVSFAPFGELRSLEGLSSPAASSPEARDERVLFELYAMHSKGVARLNIKPEHMGWDDKDEVIHAVDAEGAGVVTVSEMKLAASVEPSEASVNGDSRSVSSKPATKELVTPKKDTQPAKPKGPSSGDPVVSRTLTSADGKQDAARAAIINGADKEKEKAAATPEKSGKKKKKNGESGSQASNVSTAAPASVQQTYAKAAATPSKAPASPQKSVVAATTSSQVATMLPTRGSVETKSSPLRSVEDNITTTLAQLFNKELDSLYRKFDEDKRVQDAANAAKQDAVLRLVSSTLTENVEKTLVRIIGDGLRQDLLPSLANQVSGAMTGKLQDVGQEIQLAVGMHHKPAVLHAIGTLMQDPDFHNALGDAVASRVTKHIDTHLSAVLNKSITPAFTNLTVKTVQQIAGDMEQRMAKAMESTNAQRHNDSLKIDQLTGLVRSLSETVNTMASAQNELQRDIQLLQRHVAASSLPSSATPRGVVTGSAETEKEARPPTPKTAEELEEDEIKALLGRGEFEGAMTRFVQSERQTELFANILHRCTPAPLRRVSALVGLSVAAAVSEPWDPNRAERLAWLEVLLDCLNVSHPDIRHLSERILDIIATRLQTLYMGVVKTDADRSSPLLARIFGLHQRAVQLRQASQGMA